MIQDGKREDNIPITVDNLFWALVLSGPGYSCLHHAPINDLVEIKLSPAQATVYRITIMHTATDTAGRPASSQPQHILEDTFFKF